MKDQSRPLSLPVRWYMVTLSGLMVLVGLYVWLHSCYPGSAYIKLTTQEVVDIGNIFYQPVPPATPVPKDTSRTGGATNQATDVNLDTKRAFSIQREQVFRYMFGKYTLQNDTGGADTTAFRRNFEVYDTEREFVGALANYPIRVASYFWLTDNCLYAEVIFWALFGVIASLLYYVSEAMGKNGPGFDRSEIPTHVAKVFYAPLCAVVIFLSIDLLTTDGSVNIVRMNAGVVVLSFILGFFSGRTIELLTRIKDLILPVSPDKATQAKAQETAAAEPVPVAIIDEAIRTYSEAWHALYPNVVGIASKQKYVNGKQTPIHSIVFEVVKKVATIEEGKIPGFINYATHDNRIVRIPTDVYETGEVTASALIAGLDKAMMGYSVSAKEGLTTGSMGLKMFRFEEEAKKSYLLSCYHVLCASQLGSQITTVSDTNIDVVVPGVQDGPGQVIGQVTQGRLDTTHDFALVALQQPELLNFHIHERPNAPSGTTVVSSFDTNHRAVFLAGRTSGSRSGMIASHLWEGRIRFSDTFSLFMKGIVQTSRISDKGDSGAAVVDTEGRVIGLLIADDAVNQFSYVLPVNQFVKDNNLNMYTADA